MRLRTNTLELDIKVMDRYRKWFSTVGQEGLLSSSCVILGDSDIDYNLAPNIANSRILSAPYNVEGIKHKLIYNGVGKNLSGLIKCFARKVINTGHVLSTYDYPSTNDFSLDVTPPTLENGLDVDFVTFDNTKMGYILYLSTVLDYYLTEEGVKKRLGEIYTFHIDWNDSETIPVNWDLVIDNENGSLLIAKEAGAVGGVYTGTITATGQTTNKIKKIKFNL